MYEIQTISPHLFAIQIKLKAKQWLAENVDPVAIITLGHLVALYTKNKSHFKSKGEKEQW